MQTFCPGVRRIPSCWLSGETGGGGGGDGIGREKGSRSHEERDTAIYISYLDR